MSTEDLMKPRFKVIADYPNSIVAVGAILPFHERLEKYPHLFRKLQWWEDRTIDEMPEYVKFDNEARNSTLSINEYTEPDIHKVKKHWAKDLRNDLHSGSYKCFVSEWLDHNYSYCGFLPATESEYLKYISTIQKATT